MAKSNKPYSNSNFLNNGEDDSGMLSSLEVMDLKQKVDFIKKLLNNIMMPTMNVLSALQGEEMKNSDLAMIMSVFSSVHLDCDLFNLTIVKENANTRVLEENYKRNKFYMLSSAPVIDKKTNGICILLEFYKKAITDPLVFLEEVRQNNAEILGYLYIKELVSLAQKNYRNKFTLANRARVYIHEKNPTIGKEMLDQTAVAFAKMATEYHVNSMLIDNMKNLKRSYGVSSNIEYLKKSNMVLYNEKYKYTMTQLEILELLLEDAVIEFIDFDDQQQEQQSSQSGNGNSNNSNPQTDNSDGDTNTDDMDGGSSNSSSDSSSSNSQSGSESSMDPQQNSGDSSEDSNQGDLSRESAYNRNNDKGSMIKVTFKSDGNIIQFIKMPPKRENDRYDRLDQENEDAIDQYQDYIDYTISKMKGTGMQEILAKIGCPIEIDMSWEEKVIKYVDDITNISSSQKEMATWSKINIYTRHIAALPGRKQLPESYPTIYLMFDQSGSMSNPIIRKINYVIQYFYNKKYRINVFVHDDAQTVDDVEVYEFTSYKKDSFELENLINSRIRSGGTSHKGVFDLMAQYVEEIKTRGNKKYNSHYVLIASDLYSDIENIYEQYEWIRLLGKNVIALTDSKDMKLPFGQTILIE